MRSARLPLVVAAAAAIGLSSVVAAATPSASSGGGANSDNAAPRPTIDASSAIVQLNGDPLSTYVKTRPAAGKKIDFNSSTVKAYRAQLNQLRNDFKKWLHANAPRAQVTGQFDIALNAVAVDLNGTSLDLLRTAPQVSSVDYEGFYYPTSDPIDPDLALIHAVDAWNQSGGSADAGAGVKVAIVDTGIDITNPCFSDGTYATHARFGDRTFTNNKVIAARVFGPENSKTNYTPAALQEHGTHVAGTVACNFETPASVAGVDIPYRISGVAPRALLGNYNVFPGDIENSRSQDIFQALEAAYTDGMDVANMSLGGGFHGASDILVSAVNNLDAADMVVAVAAGNDGPNYFTVGSPGAAERALTAGASTVPHFVGSRLDYSGGTTGVAAGSFGEVASDLTAPLAVEMTSGSSGVVMGLGCTVSPDDLSGKIAVVSRGTCSFATKIRNARDAGADAVIVVNNVAGDPVAMGEDGTADQPTTMPAYMAPLGARDGLIAAAGAAATLHADLEYFATSNANIMAGFSSRGPVQVSYRVKPDVVAPGVNVLSSIPHQFCDDAPCFAFFQGTSMATPHLAGSAAVVLGQHSTWSAAQVRSAIVNTADDDILTSYTNGTTKVTNPNIVGAGLENLDAAVAATVALDPVSISFGAVPATSGPSRTQLTITNLSSSTQTFTLSVGDAPGVTFGVTPTTGPLAPGASATVFVTMSLTPGTAAQRYATLTVSNGTSTVAHAVVYVLVG